MKSTKILAALLAVLMLASAGTLSVFADSLPIFPTTSGASGSTGSGYVYPANWFYTGSYTGGIIKIAEDSYMVPVNTGNGTTYITMTAAQLNNYYGFNPTYWGQTGAGLPMQTYNITLDQFQNYTLPYANVTAISSDLNIVTVVGNMIVAKAPGTATIKVYSSSNNLYYVQYNVTVNSVTVDPSKYYVNVYAYPATIAVNTTCQIYTQVFYNNAIVNVEPELSLDSNASGILSLDASAKTVSGIGVGVGTVIAKIPNTTVSNAVNVTVVSNTNYNTQYNYLYPWMPNNTTTNYGTWTVTVPGTGSYLNYIINPNGTVVYPGYNGYNYSTPYNPYQIYNPYQQTNPYQNKNPYQNAYDAYLKAQGIDTDKYDVEYKTMFLNGQWRSFMVLVPKDEAKKTETAKPDTTSTKLTEEERKKAEEEAAKKAIEAAEKKAKAEREAAEKAAADKIKQAQAGKIGWYEVYKDLNKDSYYYTAVKYMLNIGVLEPQTSDKFGSTELITKGEVEKALAAYYKFVTSKEYKPAKPVAEADKEDYVSRQELAKIVFEFAKTLGIDTSARKDLARFDDAKKIAADYKEAYSWVIAESIFNKTESTLFAGDMVERGRFAVILFNLDGMLDIG